MDLRNIDLTGPSNDPSQGIQDRCEIGDILTSSPCSGCPDEKKDKNDCLGTRNRCPGGKATPYSEKQNKWRDAIKKKAAKRIKKPCAYPGCKHTTTGEYCIWHARRITSRINKFKIRFGKTPPIEYIHLPFSTNGKRRNLVEVHKQKYGELPY